ncbi:hypothetical protein CCO03_12650 [Comamonas serinivorans]|uniref:Peptidase S11 D-alanyl-D-alanine carboxypeptidase A N-terminal domain-containing protein n=1 Tax=Comamonas serinivorans TaxID=1082851 RepID=A0A1Y0EQA0_9BURK|nr:serine hydrolase [Comamonas serinivorans]ARU05422.1 hypothetical protein CCO03_12650 [Comamonas serinivorans]
MYDVSRFSLAVKAVPHRIKRESKTWLLACTLSLAGLALAPLAQAKEAPRKPAASKSAPKASKAAVAKATKASPAKSSAKAEKTAKGKAKPAATARDTQEARNGKGKNAKGRATALAEAPKNRKAVREDRVRAVSLAKSARAEVARAPARLSFAERAGLDQASDPIGLASSAAIVIDQDTQEMLLSKNERAVLPIASITKLMTGLLVSEAKQPLDETITISDADVDTLKGTRSRLPVGTQLSRGELLHLALMSSENRAAHALGRTYPGGIERFVSAMNAKARLLGMTDTHYVEPTGLSNQNQSSPADLARLVGIAAKDPLLSALTTSPGFEVALGNRFVQFNNTNRLVHEPSWTIGLQKTGYISEAGQCLVMQSRVNGRNLVMVFLDSNSTSSRIADAQRVRRWVEDSRSTTLAHHGG